MKKEPARERKPLDNALGNYLEAIAAAAAATLPPDDEERVRLRRAWMLQAREERGAIAGLPNGVETRDVAISPQLGGRLYTPADARAPRPILVYAHGGGWVVGSIETHDPFCRLLSDAADVIVFAVEFRLAPEHLFPGALDDVMAAYKWAAAHAGDFGGDATRLVLGGDSAGANLAAVTTNRICATAEAVRPAALMLLYPVTDHPSAGHASYSENATGCGLDASLMEWFWSQYAPHVSPDDPRISPLRLNSQPALPPTLVATAEYDPLRDEGIAYAGKLKAAGVAVTHLHAPDMHHNFPVHPGTVARFPQSIAALNEFAGWLRSTM
jgi:acetyl esterase